MKRSNRLVLLVGVFLAIIAFVGVLLLNGSKTDTANTPPTELPTVLAAKDLALGSRITAADLKVETKAVVARDVGSFGDVSQVIGKIVRSPISAGAAIVPKFFEGGGGSVIDIACPATLRCMSVQVDQVTGVGTVIKTGDHVDLVAAMGDPNFPLVIPFASAAPGASSAPGIGVVPYGPHGEPIYNPRSSKLLLQGLQVMGTLLPPPTAQANEPTASGQPAPGTALNGQQEIVILAVDAQQAEVIQYVQLDASVSLVLRSPEDFIDSNGKPLTPAPDVTTGIILKSLIDTYGVLPPQVVQAVPAR